MPRGQNSSDGFGIANYIYMVCRVAQVVEQNETEVKAEGVSLSAGSSPATATKTLQPNCKAQ